MKAKVLQKAAPKTFVVVLDAGDEAVSALTELASAHRLSAARFTGIGAFSDVTVGYFLRDRKEYKRLPMREQMEVLSVVGDITLDEGGEPKVHGARRPLAGRNEDHRARRGAWARANRHARLREPLPGDPDRSSRARL